MLKEVKDPNFKGQGQLLQVRRLLKILATFKFFLRKENLLLMALVSIVHQKDLKLMIEKSPSSSHLDTSRSLWSQDLSKRTNKSFSLNILWSWPHRTLVWVTTSPKNHSQLISTSAKNSERLLGNDSRSLTLPKSWRRSLSSGRASLKNRSSPSSRLPPRTNNDMIRNSWTSRRAPSKGETWHPWSNFRATQISWAKLLSSPMIYFNSCK